MWRDMHVPGSDAELLYDLGIKDNDKSAPEIGTSTGYSGIFIAGHYEFIMDQDNYERTLDSRGGGILISYKKPE